MFPFGFASVKKGHHGERGWWANDRDTPQAPGDLTTHHVSDQASEWVTALRSRNGTCDGRFRRLPSSFQIFLEGLRNTGFAWQANEQL